MIQYGVAIIVLLITVVSVIMNQPLIAAFMCCLLFPFVVYLTAKIAVYGALEGWRLFMRDFNNGDSKIEGKEKTTDFNRASSGGTGR